MNAFDRMRATARQRKLCKDTENGMIFGVCAGVAWWLGVKTWMVRLAAVLGLIFLTGSTLIVYAVAALVLNRRPRDRHADFAKRYGLGSDYEDLRRRWDRFERGF